MVDLFLCQLSYYIWLIIVRCFGVYIQTRTHNDSSINHIYIFDNLIVVCLLQVKKTLFGKRLLYGPTFANPFHSHSPPTTVVGVHRVYGLSAVHPSVSPCVRPLSDNTVTYCAWRDISARSGGISTKLATNNYHVSGHCWKGFQGQKSKVKVITRKMHFSAKD